MAIAFALGWYMREHGSYPGKLDELVPKYLPKVPGDLFSGKEPIYCPASDAYLLYSIGLNERDDGGRGPKDQPPGDDLSVRMPLRAIR